MPVSGSDQMRAVARDLRAAGATGRGLRAKLRRNLTVAMTPMRQEVKANARSIPVTGTRSTGLRERLDKATRIRVLTAGKNVTVGVIVDGAKMPPDQRSLPAAVEGEGRPWRHPVPNTDVWVQQESHPIVAPAIPKTVVAAAAAVDAALEQTALELSRGTRR